MTYLIVFTDMIGNLQTFHPDTEEAAKEFIKDHPSQCLLISTVKNDSGFVVQDYTNPRKRREIQ